jgi:hypothetical protein
MKVVESRERKCVSRSRMMEGGGLPCADETIPAIEAMKEWAILESLIPPAKGLLKKTLNGKPGLWRA